MTLSYFETRRETGDKSKAISITNVSIYRIDKMGFLPALFRAGGKQLCHRPGRSPLINHQKVNLSTHLLNTDLWLRSAM